MVIGERIELARTARGLNQRQLGEKTSLTAAAISKMETGQSIPTAENLATIATATGFALPFFQKQRQRLIPPLYRKNASMGRKRLDFIEALSEVYAEAFESACRAAAVNLPSRIPQLTADNADNIEAAAEETRKALGVPVDQPCDHLLSVVEQAGCAVLQLQWVQESFDGFSSWAANRPVVVIDKGIEGVGDRDRWTVAHELGHLVLHRNGGPEQKLGEQQANQFGGAFLMPREAITRDLRATSITPVGLAPLKAKWRVSIQALLMRAAHLSLLSEGGKRRAFMEMNARNWRKREPVAIPLEHPQVFKRVLGILRSRYPNLSLEAACGGLATGDVAAVLGFQIRHTDQASNTEQDTE